MQALICNKEHPEYGCAAIPFPIPDAEYAHCMEMLEALGIGGVMARDCYVDQFEDAPPMLDFLEGETVNIDELDFLMRSLDRYTCEEMAKFQSMAAARGYTEMADLINLSFCCEQATVITDFSDLEAVGKSHYLAINGGCAPVETYKQLNGAGIARGLIASGSGVVTPYGVVYDNGMKLEQTYRGRAFPAYGYGPSQMDVNVSVGSENEGTFLQLPMPRERLERMLERGGVRPGAPAVVEIETEVFPSAVYEAVEDEFENMDQDALFRLNDLCALAGGLSAVDQKKLAAVVTYAEPQSVYQVRQLAENLEQFDFVPDVKTAVEYGRYMICESGHFSYDERLEEIYNFEGYGQARIDHEEGKFTEQGYVAYHGTLSLDELMMEEPAAQEQTMGQQMQ